MESGVVDHWTSFKLINVDEGERRDGRKSRKVGCRRLARLRFLAIVVFKSYTGQNRPRLQARLFWVGGVSGGA